MMDTVLITGTTSGIGKALAEKFADAGNNLILVSRDKDKLRQQQSELQARYSISVAYIPCNLADAHAVNQIMEQVHSLGLSVDILVNNAGFNEAGCFADTDLSKELEMVQIHICTLTELTKLLLPEMIGRRYGRILNIGSTGSYLPCPCDAVYAATKAYVLSFSSSLHQELRGTGVTVTCLCPGATRTLFASKANISSTRLFKHFVMQPEAVAAIGYKNLLKGKRAVTPGAYNKCLVLFSKLLPAAILTSAAQWMMEA